MYSAIDISRYMVKRFIEHNKPATNMKIQKLLYYAWIEYYKSKGKSSGYLYNDKIFAWKFGPVVQEVYYEYRIFAAMPITFTKDPSAELDKETTDFLDGFIDKHSDDTAIRLMMKTHNSDSPWAKVYREGEHDIEIPFDKIIEIECQQ